MSDPSSVAVLAKPVMTAAKAMKDFEKKFDAAQFKTQLAELMSDLADLKISSSELLETLDAKDKEILEMKKSFGLKANVYHYKDYRYLFDEEDMPNGYPLYNRCYEEEGRMRKLVMYIKNPPHKRRFKCQVCESTYIDIVGANQIKFEGDLS